MSSKHSLLFTRTRSSLFSSIDAFLAKRSASRRRRPLSSFLPRPLSQERVLLPERVLSEGAVDRPTGSLTAERAYSVASSREAGHRAALASNAHEVRRLEREVELLRNSPRQSVDWPREVCKLKVINARLLEELAQTRKKC